MSDKAFSIGNVQLMPKLTRILELEADAFVNNMGDTQKGEQPDTSGWFKQMVRSDSEQEAIVQELARHAPFQLGDVVVTGAGNLNARYLLNAVISELSDVYPIGQIITDEIVHKAAQKCIRIAGTLALKSIAFTPWGTRIGATEAAHVTAVMVNAIVSELRVNPGTLEIVYLISHNEEHYQWFVDRVSIFQIINDQVSQIRQEIEAADIPTIQQNHLLKMLEDLQTNVIVYNEIVGGDKIEANVINSNGVALGRESTASTSE